MSRFEASNVKQISNINVQLGLKANQTDLTAALVSEMIPSQTSIPLKGLTIGNFYMPRTNVTLDTVTLG